VSTFPVRPEVAAVCCSGKLHKPLPYPETGGAGSLPARVIFPSFSSSFLRQGAGSVIISPLRAKFLRYSAPLLLWVIHFVWKTGTSIPCSFLVLGLPILLFPAGELLVHVKSIIPPAR